MCFIWERADAVVGTTNSVVFVSGKNLLLDTFMGKSGGAVVTRAGITFPFARIGARACAAAVGSYLAVPRYTRCTDFSGALELTGVVAYTGVTAIVSLENLTGSAGFGAFLFAIAVD